MNDRDVQKVLTEGYPIAAILLSRGGWLSGSTITLEARFEADLDKGLDALWMINVSTQDDTQLHSIYVKAETIIGISCRRSQANADEK